MCYPWSGAVSLVAAGAPPLTVSSWRRIALCDNYTAYCCTFRTVFA